MLETDGQAADNDIANFESLRSSAASSSTQCPGGVDGEKTVIKPEKKTAVEVEKEMVEAFTKAQHENLMLVSTSMTELKIMAITAGEHKFTVAISEPATKLSNKFHKVHKSLESWSQTPSCLREKGIVVLIQQFNAVQREKKIWWSG